ncbi:MAG: hypothetical protein QMD05_10515, partial [Candidatus Brocadiaceae bacterium]|nr:hypothetical protein [Candidatus Brocadiaceae bacterium]
FSSFVASHYVTEQFSPFVNYYVSSGFQNPWDFFYEKGILKVFPYSTVMLWVFTIPRLLFSPLMPSGD